MIVGKVLTVERSLFRRTFSLVLIPDRSREVVKVIIFQTTKSFDGIALEVLKGKVKSSDTSARFMEESRISEGISFHTVVKWKRNRIETCCYCSETKVLDGSRSSVQGG